MVLRRIPSGHAAQTPTGVHGHVLWRQPSRANRVPLRAGRRCRNPQRPKRSALLPGRLPRQCCGYGQRAARWAPQAIVPSRNHIALVRVRIVDGPSLLPSGAGPGGHFPKGQQRGTLVWPKSKPDPRRFRRSRPPSSPPSGRCGAYSTSRRWSRAAAPRDGCGSSWARLITSRHCPTAESPRRDIEPEPPQRGRCVPRRRRDTSHARPYHMRAGVRRPSNSRT